MYLDQNESMVKDQDYDFRFRLINPSLKQSGDNTSISVISSQGSLTRIYPQQMTFFARIYPQQMTFSTDSTVVGVVDGVIIPKCIIPTFHGSSIIQSNPLVGDKNILTTTMRSNSNLVVSDQSNIVIRGLGNALLSQKVSLLP